MADGAGMGSRPHHRAQLLPSTRRPRISTTTLGTWTFTRPSVRPRARCGGAHPAAAARLRALTAEPTWCAANRRDAEHHGAPQWQSGQDSAVWWNYMAWAQKWRTGPQTQSNAHSRQSSYYQRSHPECSEAGHFTNSNPTHMQYHRMFERNAMHFQTATMIPSRHSPWRPTAATFHQLCTQTQFDLHPPCDRPPLYRRRAD